MCLGLPWRGDIFDISVYLRFEIFQHEAGVYAGAFPNKRFCAKSEELGGFYERSTPPMAFVRRKMGRMTRLTGAKNIRIDFLTAVAAEGNHFTSSLCMESSDSHTSKMILTTSR